MDDKALLMMATTTAQLKRIADAIEEILRLVKKDMEPRTKKKDA